MLCELVSGKSKAFTEVINRADRYARCPWTVLLLGETGVGKELLARRIHFNSPRASAPFVPVNCGAITPTLFESELFGHERGAFSGAVQSFRGLVRQAHGGTLFLDEIGELDMTAQVKLLRLLDSGEVRAIGSLQEKVIDVRVVAATNLDLHGAVGLGKFRHDLLERLTVLPLFIPPLRERKEDIAPIAESIAAKLKSSLPREAVLALSLFDWPGNIRQLKNVLCRASILDNQVISAKTIGILIDQEKWLSQKSAARGWGSIDGTLEEIEKQVIVERLRRCHGNRKKTAEELGIAKSTLHEKIRRWKSESPQMPCWPLSRWSNVGFLDSDVVY